MIRSRLGLGPWDALYWGTGRQLGIPVGQAGILISVVIVAGLACARRWPGPGTVATMVMVGLLVDLLMPLVPEAHGWPMRLGYYLVGIAALGAGTGFYISARLGPGPRDMLMLALVHRSGRSIRVVRTAIEILALAAGWAMGAPIGIGTVIFALLVGHSVQLGIRTFAPFAIPAPADGPPSRAAEAERRRKVA